MQFNLQRRMDKMEHFKGGIGSARTSRLIGDGQMGTIKSGQALNDALSAIKEANARAEDKGQKKFWTDENIQKLKEMKAQGMKSQAIAEHFGVSTHAIDNKWSYIKSKESRLTKTELVKRKDEPTEPAPKAAEPTPAPEAPEPTPAKKAEPLTAGAYDWMVYSAMRKIADREYFRFEDETIGAHWRELCEIITKTINAHADTIRAIGTVHDEFISIAAKVAAAWLVELDDE